MHGVWNSSPMPTEEEGEYLAAALIHDLSAMDAHYMGCTFLIQSPQPLISHSEGSYWTTDSICLKRIQRMYET
jgi:hypothetical protein